MKKSVIFSLLLLSLATPSFAKTVLVCQSQMRIGKQAVVSTNSGLLNEVKLTYGDFKSKQVVYGTCVQDLFPKFELQKTSDLKSLLVCKKLLVETNDPFMRDSGLSAEIQKNTQTKRYSVIINKRIKVIVPGSDPLFPKYDYVNKLYDSLLCKRK